MIRAAVAAGLLGVVLAGGFAIGIIRALTDEVWPDWDD